MAEKWEKFKKSRYSYLTAYTVLFVVSAIVILFRFGLYKKSIIWYQDGLKQHYNALLYYGKYLRQIAETLFKEHRFELPMWDFTIGYGSDIITTFHYYAVGDPLALLSALVPSRYCQHFYFLLYLLRLYLAGLSFSAFAFRHKRGRFGVLTGSLIYVFSAYSMVLGLMHPFFVAPLVWFPLILLGIDKIIDGESPLIFIIFTSIAAMSNFYFFYMEIALAVLYTIYRYICLYRKFGIRGFFTLLGKFIVFGLNAFLISAVIMMPVLNVMFSSKRLAASEASSVDIFYPFNYYVNFMAGFTNASIPGAWTLMGYTSLGLLALAFMVAVHKKYRHYLVVFGILTILAVIPAGGYILNGFSYVVNRWIWGYAMTVAYITARVLDDIKAFTYAARRRAAIIVFVYCAVYSVFGSSRSQQTMASAVILLILALVILLFDIAKTERKIFRSAVICILLLGFSLNSYYKMSLNANPGWIEEFLDRGEADKKLTEENPDILLFSVSDNDFYRIEEVGLDTTQNSSIHRRVYGTQFYHSMTNPYISEFIDHMYMNWPKDYDYEGVESRSILEALASVKYFFVGEGADAERPFNYSRLVVSGNTPLGQVAMYEADTALPLGYTYSEYFPVGKFEEMDPAERADAMLSAAVMEDSSFKEATVSSDSADVLDSIESKGRINISENSFFVRGSGTVTLKLDALPDAETYVVFDNLRYRGVSERDTYDDGEWANLTEYEKNLVLSEDRKGKTNVSSSLMVSYKDISKVVEILSPGADFYCGRSDFLVNLGYNEDAPDEVTLSFRNPGEYTFDSIRVISKPVADISEEIRSRAEDVMTDTVIGVNKVSGKISLDKDKILLLTVPYSEGWTACVDGKKAELKRANIMYMALELAAGDHEIELRYETPYLRTGAFMSLAGIAMAAVLMGIRIFIKRKGNRC